MLRGAARLARDRGPGPRAASIAAHVHCDRGTRIDAEILVNLLVNAADAIRAGGARGRSRSAGGRAETGAARRVRGERLGGGGSPDEGCRTGFEAVFTDEKPDDAARDLASQFARAAISCRSYDGRACGAERGRVPGAKVTFDLPVTRELGRRRGRRDFFCSSSRPMFTSRPR